MKEKDLFKICYDMTKDIFDDLDLIKCFDMRNVEIKEEKEKENPIKKFLKNNQKRVDIYKKR